MKDRDDICDPLDELHIVFNHHDRGRGVERLEKLGCPYPFFLIHTGRRFVKQDKTGAASHHHADLDPLSLAVRQLAYQLVDERPELEFIDNPFDTPVRGLFIGVELRGQPKVFPR